MDEAIDYRIKSVAKLRELIGEPNAITSKKLLTALDEAAKQFIQRSPFLILGTADADGNQDVSPKGDAPGFVLVENDTTLIIPDRRGNKLLFGLQNIISNPQVGIVFMVPGTGETLRVNGMAELTTEPELIARLVANGQPAVLAIRVTVRECFFHCAKAFIRSQLWRAETWPERSFSSWGKYIGQKIGTTDDAAEKIDRVIQQDYDSVDPSKVSAIKAGQ